MSNKAERKKIKEAKQAAAKRKQQLNAWIIKAAVIIMVPLILFVFYQGLFTGPPTMPPDMISDADHVRGAEDADVTMTIYADFQCPACLTESDVIARAWREIQDEVRLVYRHFPLDTHRFAFQAARYAEAAGKQGKFWEMHNLLFSNQTLWSTLEDATLFFEGYAEELELDMDQLHVDIESTETRAKINADQQSGIRAGVRSTPAMYLNGRLVSNPQSPGRLIEMIREAQSG